MGATRTISATEFNASCLELLDRIQAGEVSRVEVTQGGRVVAVMTPAPASAATTKGLHGALRGRVLVPESLDLTAPIVEDEFRAARSVLQG